MPEGVVRHLEVIEIDDEQTPSSGYDAAQAGQGALEAPPIGEPCQGVERDAALTIVDPRLARHGEAAQVYAEFDKGPFAGSWAAAFPEIERDRGNDLSRRIGERR